MKWFEVALKKKDAETEKVVTEKYMVDALTFAEAEMRSLAYLLGDGKSAEVEVETENGTRLMNSVAMGGECITLKKVAISDVITNDDKEAWYKVKVCYISIDNGKEKRTTSTMMVEADTVADAYKMAVNFLRDSMADYEIVGVTKTDILDLIKYEN